MPIRGIRVGLGCLALVFVTNTGFWLGSARSSLLSYAWTAHLSEQIPRIRPEYRPSCVAVEPVLYSETPVALREAVRDELSEYGIRLLVAPPTHAGALADRECLEIYALGQYAEDWAFNLPGIGTAAIAYNAYDSNVDAVLMLQLGRRWIYLRGWNVID